MSVYAYVRGYLLFRRLGFETNSRTYGIVFFVMPVRTPARQSHSGGVFSRAGSDTVCDVLFLPTAHCLLPTRPEGLFSYDKKYRTNEETLSDTAIIFVF